MEVALKWEKVTHIEKQPYLLGIPRHIIVHQHLVAIIWISGQIRLVLDVRHLFPFQCYLHSVKMDYILRHIIGSMRYHHDCSRFGDSDEFPEGTAQIRAIRQTPHTSDGVERIIQIWKGRLVEAVRSETEIQLLFGCDVQ